MERLFHTNQLLIASDFFEARAATIGAPPEAYLEWADTSPVPMSTVAEELGVLPVSSKQEEAAHELAMFGPEQTERGGTPLFFRSAEQRPSGLHSGAPLRSQQMLVAGMLRPAYLLDLMRNFTVFRQVDGKTRKVGWRATSSSALSIKRLPACRKAAPARRARSVMSVAASSGTRRAPGRVSAWSFWCARCA